MEPTLISRPGDVGTRQFAFPTHNSLTTEVEVLASHEPRVKPCLHVPIGFPNEANATEAIVPPFGQERFICGAGNFPAPLAFHSPITPHVPDTTLGFLGV